jgi:hypothetical protein
LPSTSGPVKMGGVGDWMMSKRTQWTIFIVGNAVIAVVLWLTAPRVLGERPPLWVWAIAAGVIVAADAVLAVRRRRPLG